MGVKTATVAKLRGRFCSFFRGLKLLLNQKKMYSLRFTILVAFEKITQTNKSNKFCYF